MRPGVRSTLPKGCRWVNTRRFRRCPRCGDRMAFLENLNDLGGLPAYTQTCDSCRRVYTWQKRKVVGLPRRLWVLVDDSRVPEGFM